MTSKRDTSQVHDFLFEGALTYTTLKYLAAIAACSLFAGGAPAQSAKDLRGPSPSVAIADDKASPIFGVTIPAGYRQWELIAPPQETGELDELRGILGNTVAMKAYGEGTLPFPDGAILVKLAWKHVPPPEAEGAFVPGRATTVQIMVKDSKNTPQRAVGDSADS